MLLYRILQAAQFKFMYMIRGKLQELHLGENADIRSARLPGEKSAALLAAQLELEGSIVSYPRNMPIAIHRALGAIIEDVDGNRFIDFFSCAGVLNVGHSNPYVLEYVKAQQEKLVHALDFPTENKISLIRKILDEVPAGKRSSFKVSFCGPSGSDAVEAAIKLAKHATGREGVIAFEGSYHGMTSGALAATSNSGLREKIHSLVPHIHFIPYSYCYRCIFNREPATCSFDCADYLKHVLTNPHSGIPKPAAIILEPIQGEGGSVIPKAGYLEKIIRIARENDVIVIFDEIQCGFFRAGSFWSFQDSDVYPDIITMSKGLGGIGFPISAIIYNKSIESWGPGDHIGTFRGNQVSIAAGNGAFDFIRDFGIEQHVEEMGDYLLSRLNELQRLFPQIGEVRGKGMMFGIEYVKSKVSRVPDPDIVKRIRQYCFERGLLFEVGGHYNNVIRLLPPLVSTRTIIDNALSIFESANRAMTEAAATVGNLPCLPSI
jgi:diaminobutyrate-2-oxoglutarate transaminase